MFLCSSFALYILNSSGAMSGCTFSLVLAIFSGPENPNENPSGCEYWNSVCVS